MYILVHKVCMYSNTLRWLSLPLHCIFISKKLLSCTRGALARAAPVPQILLPDFTITQSTPSEWRKVEDKGKDPHAEGEMLHECTSHLYRHTMQKHKTYKNASMPRLQCAFIAALFFVLPLLIHQFSWLSDWSIIYHMTAFMFTYIRNSVSRIVTIQFDVRKADEGLWGWNIHNSCNRGHAFTSPHCSNHRYTAILIGKMNGF